MEMKKVLFCAGLVALAASCTNDEFESIVAPGNTATEGITFNVSLAGDADTKGEITEGANGGYPFFWYAEQDRINVWAYNNVAAGTNNTNENGIVTAVSGGAWTLPSTPAAAAQYKATQSLGEGKFTAVNDQNLLTFEDAMPENVTEATRPDYITDFVASYNSTITGVGVSTADGRTITSVTLTTTAATNAQAIAAGSSEGNIAPMYSVSQGWKDENYESVGENVNLRFLRPLALGRFKTKGIDEDYAELFGKLQSITLTAKGYTPAAGAAGSAVPASNLAYSGASKRIVINVSDKDDYSGYTAGDAPAVTLTYTGGKEWTDNDIAFMTLLPVDRAAFRNAGVKEDLRVEYKFDNITLTKEGGEDGWATSSDWTTLTTAGGDNGVVPMPVLDIASYPYLVTINSTTNEVALIVNSGNFADALTENNTEIDWEKSLGTNVTVAEVNEIVSEVALSADEMALLSTFTGLKRITLKANTSIPAGTFTAAQAAQMTNINLPVVTEIDPGFISGQNSAFGNTLVELTLPAYNFKDEAVNAKFFNDNTKTSLTTLDISGVQSMMPIFGIDRSLSFDGYTALTTLTVTNSNEGIRVAPNGFKGCKALKTINGKLNLSGAVSAFEMSDNSTNANTVLESVEITGTEIPQLAFKNCTGLKSIKYNGAELVPTGIGSSAFENATSLEYMDLSKATEIGEYAFSGCTNYKGAKAGENVLAVGVNEVEEGIFVRTAVYMVTFTNATVINPDIFGYTTRLTQVKFEKPFVVASATLQQNVWANTFGTAANVDLFIAEGQQYMSGTTMRLPALGGTANIVFHTVQYE